MRNDVSTRLAATLWAARTNPVIGDGPWMDGCKSVDEYVTASDLRHWIHLQEDGVSKTDAKKFVSHITDADLALSKHRLAVRKRIQRKNGLEYAERKLLPQPTSKSPARRVSSSSPQQYHERRSRVVDCGRQHRIRASDRANSSDVPTWELLQTDPVTTRFLIDAVENKVVYEYQDAFAREYATNIPSTNQTFDCLTYMQAKETSTTRKMYVYELKVTHHSTTNQ